MGKRKEINKLAIFEGKEIRRILVDEEWYYSVVDVVGVLTDSNNPRSYWSKLKERELESDVQLSTICLQLKIKSSDGKKYLTDCADNEGLFRIIQSIPSKKAEPFKRWLAKLGKERLDEIEQPSRAIERAKNYYTLKGYSKRWIETRTASIDARHDFTDVLKSKGIRDKEYGILTNEMYRSTFGFDAVQYKYYKELNKSDSLRDNMTPLELASTIFSEATATEFLEQSHEKGFWVTRDYVLKAGNITKEAIEKIEKQTGRKVVTRKNYRDLNLPSKQKEIIRQSLSELEAHMENPDEDLPDFDKKLKGLLNVPPEKKD